MGWVDGVKRATSCWSNDVSDGLGNDIAPEASERIDKWGMNALLTFGHLELRMQGRVVPDSRRDRANFIFGYHTLHDSEPTTSFLHFSIKGK